MLTKILISAAISLGIFFAIALGMIVSQPRIEMKGRLQSLNFEGINSRSGKVLALPQVDAKTRDGQSSPVGYLQGDQGAPLLIMLHGSGWQGAQFTGLANGLAPNADILVPNLRGHWNGPGTRGDVDYIGQLEDDLADLIAQFAKPDQQVILLGHSSGGGLVVRMAGGAHRALIDKAILLAPFLQYDAPMTRPNSGGWAHTLVRRMVGLSMLNMVGIHALDHLTVIQFNMPRAVLDGPMGHTATTAYSWRLNQSYAPRRDWLADVAKLPEFLLVAGDKDEAFDAALYEQTLAPANANGRYEIVSGVGHLAIVDVPQTRALIEAFMK